MDRSGALRLIPRVYSLALRLRAAGVEDALVADCLDVAPEALAALYEVAEAKLATALAAEAVPRQTVPGDRARP